MCGELGVIGSVHRVGGNRECTESRGNGECVRVWVIRSVWGVGGNRECT